MNSRFNHNPYSRNAITLDRCNVYDTHEILKRENLKQLATPNPGNAGSNSGYIVPGAIGGVAPPKAQAQTQTQNNTETTPVILPEPTPEAESIIGFEDWPIYFDSIYKKAGSNISNGEITYDIPPLNNNLQIEDCIQMNINKFYFPNIINSLNSPSFYFFRKVYIQILELQLTQSTRAANGRSFIWEFDVDDLNSVAVKLTPTISSVFFIKPITAISSVTFRFMNPLFQNIPIPADTIDATAIIPSAPFYTPPAGSLSQSGFTVTGAATAFTSNMIGMTLLVNGINYIISGFTSATSITVTLSATYTAQSGVVYNAEFQTTFPIDTTPIGNTIGLQSPFVAIYASGFLSNDINLNNVINSTQGLFITRISSLNTFTIGGINLSTVLPPIPPQTLSIRIIIAKNRIAFPVRFTRVVTQNTNYITVNQN